MKYCPQCGTALVSRTIDGHDRKACEVNGCGFVYWNNPIPVVGVIAETHQGIVLARNVAFPPGLYSIITGFLEAGESPQSAAVRELKEELNLTAEHVTFLGNFPFARLNQLMIAFHILASGSVRLNQELIDYKFIQKAQLLGWSTAGNFEIQLWLDQLRVEA